MDRLTLAVFSLTTYRREEDGRAPQLPPTSFPLLPPCHASHTHRCHVLSNHPLPSSLPAVSAIPVAAEADSAAAAGHVEAAAMEEGHETLPPPPPVVAAKPTINPHHRRGCLVGYLKSLRVSESAGSSSREWSVLSFLGYVVIYGCRIPQVAEGE